MGHALVIFESMYGNTEVVALAVAEGLGERGGVDVVEVGSAPALLAADVGLVVVGGPTHAFGLSRPSTRADAVERAGRPVISEKVGVREWLEQVRVGAGRPVAAAFDTHVEHPRLLRHVGSAAASIASRLTDMGIEVVVPAEHFWVHGSLGPLVDGEEERARGWGRQIARRTELTLAGPPRS